MLRMDKFTIKVQEALVEAKGLAEQNNNQQIEASHIFHALLNQHDGITIPIFQKLGVNPNILINEIKNELDRIPKVTGYASESLLSPSLKNIIEKAWNEAEKLKDEYLSVEHILLAIADTPHDPTGRILQRYGITIDRIKRALLEVRGNVCVTDQNPEAKYQALEKYARDLTELARRDKL
ncbi:MAG: Clp protease N-terminal domain-containing protein, partial [Promethearchaeota archaeon]